MSEARRHDDELDTVAADLIEYLIVEVPDLGALASLVPALAELVDSARIRILDIVALEKDANGAVAVLEVDAVDSISALRDVDGEVGGMLSEHDIELAARALRPRTAGIVLVTEDRWAEPLSIAAQQVGGQIIGGERIPAARVQSVRTGRFVDEPASMTMRSVRTSRTRRPDLLARPPCGVRPYEDSVLAWIVDPIEQLEELADLFSRGLLSRDEFDRHKAKVIEFSWREPSPHMVIVPPGHGWC